MPNRKIRYTKEECVEIYNKCKNRTEFKKKYYGAFCRCKENGWLEEVCPSFFDWDKPITLNEAIEMTKQYENRSDLWKHDHRMFYYLEQKGWLNEIENLIPKNDKDSKIHYVYAYEFPEYNTAYIGRTDNIKKRHNQHLNNIKCVIYKFIKSKNLSNINEPKIIYEKLNAKESQEKEAEQIEKYKNDGWILLNIAKAGSLGTLSYKYTKKVCYDLAKQFTTKKEFRETYKNVYSKCLEKGWVKDYYWLKNSHRQKRIFTYEECKNVCLQYKTRSEFKDKHPCMYLQTLKNGWIDDFIKSKIIHNIIVQYNLEGKFVKVFNKIHETFGKKSDLINKVSKNNKHYAYKCFWFVLEDVTDENGEIKKEIDISKIKFQIKSNSKTL